MGHPFCVVWEGEGEADAGFWWEGYVLGRLVLGLILGDAFDCVAEGVEAAVGVELVSLPGPGAE